jgi:hypothetical protein
LIWVDPEGSSHGANGLAYVVNDQALHVDQRLGNGPAWTDLTNASDAIHSALMEIIARDTIDTKVMLKMKRIGRTILLQIMYTPKCQIWRS